MAGTLVSPKMGEEGARFFILLTLAAPKFGFAFFRLHLAKFEQVPLCTRLHGSSLVYS